MLMLLLLAGGGLLLLSGFGSVFVVRRRRIGALQVLQTDAKKAVATSGQKLQEAMMQAKISKSRPHDTFQKQMAMQAAQDASKSMANASELTKRYHDLKNKK